MEWLLTEKEMVKAKKVDTSYWHAKDEAIAKAQARKLVEWLRKYGVLERNGNLWLPRSAWQALRKELGLE